MPLPGNRFGTRIPTPRTDTTSRRLGSWSGAAPVFASVHRGLFDIVRARTPGFPGRHVLELASRTTLSSIRAKLDALGVDDFNKLGDLTLTGNIVIDKPGLYGTKPFLDSRVPALRWPGSATPVAVRFSGWHGGPAPTPVYFSSPPTWPVGESVIVADELDLRNHVVSIDRTKVSHLYIIARRIKAGTNAQITYTPLESTAVGTSGEAGGNSSRDYDPNSRQSSSGHHANNGGAGGVGGDGQQPSKALDGPSLTVCTLEMDSMPDIELPGQKGGPGGTGGRGGNGGDGQRGRDSKTIRVNCSHGPGYGGDGGAGGNGGPGGDGGVGGDGGDVVIMTQEDQITPLVTAQAFTIDIGGGAGGAGGNGGAGGSGGRGGQNGHNTGWPCRNEPDRDGDPGATGARGDRGEDGEDGDAGTLAYEIITEDEWNEVMASPWVTSLDPTDGFAGATVAVHGLNFVNGYTVAVDGTPITTVFNYDKQVTATLPVTLSGGEHEVTVVTDTGDVSNGVPFGVRPNLIEVRMAGVATTSVAPGDALTLGGTSFVSGAAVEMDGGPLTVQSLTATEIEVNIPSTVGLSAGGQVTLIVRNPDGLESDPLTLTKSPVLDLGFIPSVHGFAFQNFNNGNGSPGAFTDTFGADEILLSMAASPRLTNAFYLFYRIFLGGLGAHCTAFSCLALNRFLNGDDTAFRDGPVTSADPPAITNAQMREFDAIQGRVLSKELIIRFNDQSREGVGRVETSVREIEAAIQSSSRLNANVARVLCFIHSGNVWDLITDPVVRDAFMRAHTLVPTRIVYPDESRGLDGAKLFVYDSNRPGVDDLFIDLHEDAGTLHFTYTTSTDPLDPPDYSSRSGTTIGSATLKQMMHDDVDLPFTGSTLAFILELIMSPATIRVEDGTGKVLGVKGGKVHVDPDLGYIFPWHEKMMMVKPDVAVTRTIVGEADGTYDYASIHPSGKSLFIEGAGCSATSVDVLRVDETFSNIDIDCNEGKALKLHLAERAQSGVIHNVELAFAVQAGEACALRMAPEMNGVTVTTPNRAMDVQVTARTFDGDALTGERTLSVNVPADKAMSLPAGMWSDLRGFGITTN